MITPLSKVIPTTDVPVTNGFLIQSFSIKDGDLIRIFLNFNRKYKKK
jgi:hypothetical protein